MSANRKRKKPLVVIVINIIEIPLFLLFSGVWLFILAWIYKPEWVNFELPLWAKWLAWAFVVCGGLALLFFLDGLKKSYLEKAGYGIKALEPVIEKANKTVIVDTFEVTEVWSSPSGYGGTTQVPWTRIRVRHTGKVPCVMEVVKGNTRKIRVFDKDAYMGWKKKQKELHKVPKKVKIEGRKVPTAYPKEMISLVWDKAEHIFDDGDIAGVKGIIRIEPEQVLFLEKGNLLDGGYLTTVGNLIFRLAEKTGRIYK